MAARGGAGCQRGVRVCDTLQLTASTVARPPPLVNTTSQVIVRRLLNKTSGQS